MRAYGTLMHEKEKKKTTSRSHIETIYHRNVTAWGSCSLVSRIFAAHAWQQPRAVHADQCNLLWSLCWQQTDADWEQNAAASLLHALAKQTWLQVATVCCLSEAGASSRRSSEAAESWNNTLNTTGQICFFFSRRQETTHGSSVVISATLFKFVFLVCCLRLNHFQSVF